MVEIPPPSKSPLALRVVKILLLALILGTGIWLFASGDFRDTFQQWVLQLRSYGWKGMFLFATLYFSLGLISFPASMVTIAAGYIFGFFPGILIANLGSTLGATGIFLFGRFLFRGIIARQIAQSPYCRVLDSLIEDRGFRIVILARLSLLMPFGLLNYLFSSTRIHTGTFFLASLLGMLPGSVLYILVGSSLQNLSELSGIGFFETGSSHNQQLNQWKLVFLIVGLLASMGLVFYLGKLAKQAFQLLPEKPAK